MNQGKSLVFLVHPYFQVVVLLKSISAMLSGQKTTTQIRYKGNKKLHCIVYLRKHFPLSIWGLTNHVTCFCAFSLFNFHFWWRQVSLDTVYQIIVTEVTYDNRPFTINTKT